MVEDTEKVNKNEIFHTIKNIKKKIKSSDAESIANAPDISHNEAEILKQNPICSFADNMILQRHYLWRTYASGDIGGKDDIRDWGMNNDDWVKLCDIDFVKRYNNPEPLQHFRRLAYFRRQGFNAINSIENLKIKEEMKCNGKIHMNLWIRPQLICINFIRQNSGKQYIILSNR